MTMRRGGGIRACAFSTSLVVDHMAPIIVIAALLCAVCMRLMKAIEPVFFMFVAISLCRIVYHTSAAYVIFGAAMDRYSCHILLANILDMVQAVTISPLFIHFSNTKFTITLP